MTGRATVASSREGVLPLVVAVTGHRDLRPEDLPVLERAVRRVFQRLRRRCPHTPLLLLSSLAEGADRVVARVGLGLSVPVQLVVPIPLPEPLYEEDFVEPGSLEEYRALRDAAARVVEVPLVAGNTLELVRVPGEARNRQYAALGSFLVRNAQVLIALWDGVEGSVRAGGTAQVVRWWRSGVEAPFAASALDRGRGGTLWHLLTPRRTTSGPPRGRVGSCRALYGLGADHRARWSAHGILSAFEGFNRETIATRDLATRARRSRDRLFPADATDDVRLLTADESVLLDRYCEADAMALRHQSSMVASARGVFVLVGLAVVFFEIFAHLGLQPRYLGLYLLALGAAAAIHLTSRRPEHRHFELRALAEGLRTLLFWTVCGMPGQLADHYPRIQRVDIDTIREALVAWSIACPSGGGSADWRARAALILRRWIRHQHQYFERRWIENATLVRSSRWGAEVLLYSGLLVAASAAVVRLDLWRVAWNTWAVVASVLAASAFAVGAIAHAVVERTAWNRSRLPDLDGKLPRVARWSIALGCLAGVTATVLAAFGPRLGLAEIDCCVECGAGVLGTSGLACLLGGMAATRRQIGLLVRRQTGHRRRGWGEWVASLLPGVAAVSSAVVLILLVTSGDSSHGRGHGGCLEMLVVLTPILLAGGALLRAYSEVRAHESEAKRYEVMAAEYAAASAKLAHLVVHGTADEVRQVVFEVARDALIENGDWLLMHRDRPLQVLAGG